MATELDDEEDENRSYFCSELIAKAFKLAGVLKDCDISSAKFYPSSFSADGQ